VNDLVARGLTKQFGGLLAVDGVELTLEAGEIVGIIGPNGAGKTTLIHLISGVLLPTSGRIELRGRDITYRPAHERSRLGIARTFQIIRPFEDLIVRENVMVGALFARRLSMRESRRSAEALCELLELPDIGRRVSELTILEIKKMEIAHALAGDPTLLFLDELMAGLSVEETTEMVRTVKRIAAERGMTIGVVEHVMGVIRELTDRVIILDGGRVIREGPYEEVSRDKRVIEAYLGGEE